MYYVIWQIEGHFWNVEKFAEEDEARGTMKIIQESVDRIGAKMSYGPVVAEEMDRPF